MKVFTLLLVNTRKRLYTCTRKDVRAWTVVILLGEIFYSGSRQFVKVFIRVQGMSESLHFGTDKYVKVHVFTLVHICS